MSAELKPHNRPWQPWERNYSGGRIGVQEQQGADENWMILHVESGGAVTTTSLRLHEAWDLALLLSPQVKARIASLHEEMCKYRDALWQFKNMPTGISELLKKVADEWDCDSSRCENASGVSALGYVSMVMPRSVDGITNAGIAREVLLCLSVALWNAANKSEDGAQP